MSYPLIDPYQQFFDSSGSPLSSGTIEFRSPADNSYINSYPTADDADAQTNANDNPLTLSSTGAATSGLFLEDGVAYKVVLKDSDGNTVGTWDDVLCPTKITNAVVGAALYPTTSAETSASITVSDYSYPPGDIRRYGADTTSSTNQSAVQQAVNQYSWGGSRVFIPYGRWRCESAVYCYYDATNNTNFQNAARLWGHIYIYGEGKIEVNHFTNSEYSGSCLQFTNTTGVCLDVNNSADVGGRCAVVRDLAIIGNTTGYVVNCEYVPVASRFENLFVGNSGTGGGMNVDDVWESKFEDITLYGNASGIGFNYPVTENGGGNNTFTRVTARNFNIGFQIGAAFNSARTKFIKNWTFINCQAKSNATTGVWLRCGVESATFIDCWSEGHSSVSGAGVWLSDMCGWGTLLNPLSSRQPGTILFIGGNYADNSAATSGFMQFQIGDDTGTETTDSVGNVVMINTRFGLLNEIGIRRHEADYNGFLAVLYPSYHGNGGIPLALDNATQTGPIIYRCYDDSAFGYSQQIRDTGDTTDLSSLCHIFETKYFSWYPVDSGYSSKTITGGVMTVTGSHHAVVAQGAPANDNLDTLTASGVPTGHQVTLRAADSGDTITCKDGTGNLVLAGDFDLDHVSDRIVLEYDGTNWVEISRSDNA